jgi:hypothetical protein
MFGVITNWDILAHPAVTVQCFGWKIFFKAVFSGSENTFLSLLQGANIFGCTTPEMPDLIRRSMDLELRAKRIYDALSKTFSATNSARFFFQALSAQEQNHADLLELCQAVASRVGWKMSYLNPWQACLPRLERKMQEAEASLPSISSLDDALRLVILVESSELNQVFQDVLAASDSHFVKKTGKFRKAVASHISFIAIALPKLSPQLTQASRELFAKFFQ